MEKILIAVVIYDRFENLKRWVQSWKQCEQMGAELVIIHNCIPDIDPAPWLEYCKVNGTKYIQRANVGFDTGPFQDIVMNRLCTEIGWDTILWATDDTIPMRKSFLQEYVKTLSEPYAGVACMEMSDVVSTHVRTTGMMLKKSVTDRFYFPCNAITSKDDCYHFEHTGGKDTMTNQIIRMGLRIIKVSEIGSSPLWDTDKTDLDRWGEFYSAFQIS